MVKELAAVRNGGRRGIPIPSFASTPIDETPATWCNDNLISLDRFLVLHLKKQRIAMLSLKDFYAVARKVLSQIRSSSINSVAAEDNVAKRATAVPIVPRILTGVTEEERLLYHLVAATSPVFYRLRQMAEKELHTWTTETRQLWCLEAIAYAGSNRKQEFNKLLETKSVETTKSDSILVAIREHRKSESIAETTESPARAIEAPRTITNPLEAQIQPGMTVEERVRARAAVERKEDALRKAAAAEAGDSTVDGEWLVRLADALWSYASNMMTSQTRFHSPSKPSKSCCVGLKDAVTILRNSLATGKTLGRTPMNVSKGEKVSKRQIVDAIMELCNRFPEWTATTDPSNDKEPSKDAILRIKAVDYTLIRVQLNGTPILKNEKHQVAEKKALGVNSILHPKNPFKKKPTASISKPSVGGESLSTGRKTKPLERRESKDDPQRKKARTYTWEPQASAGDTKQRTT
jgi:hypothetical protein